MAKFSRKPDDVDAVEVTSPVGDLLHPGDYLVQHADGRLEVMAGPAFNVNYQPVELPAMAADGAPPLPA